MRIVSGIFKNRILTVPNNPAIRPSAESLREALFNICRNTVEGATVLDLFAGSGALGLEALSRGALHTTFVDSHRESIRAIRENIVSLKVEAEGMIITGDVLKVLERLAQQGKSYDLIFADPPYEKGPTKNSLYSQMVLDFIDTSSLLKPAGELFVEDAATIKLNEEHLQTLQQKSSRRLGGTSLHHYLKKG